MAAPYTRRAFATRLVKRTLSEFTDDGCPQLAASIAYHVLFSIFPLVIVLAAVTGIVLSATGSQARVVNTIVSNVPLSQSGDDQLRRLLIGATGNLSAVGLVGIVGLFYSASGMMAALRVALNSAWDVEQRRPYLRGKLVDVGLVFLVSLLGISSLGLTIASRFVGAHSGVSWAPSLLGPLVLAFGVSLFLFRVVPAAEVRLGDAWIPALFVAASFTAAENLFAVYVSHFGNYNAVYGSLGAVIAFMFFVYLVSEMFLLGAEAAAEWPRVRLSLERGEVEEPGPPLGRQLKETLIRLWKPPSSGAR